MGNHHDIIIVGGGVMGSSVAYHLLTFQPALTVAVIERDPTYARAPLPSLWVESESSFA
jgi:L-2-hydroxyglutarate oxidase LhgO